MWDGRTDGKMDTSGWGMGQVVLAVVNHDSSRWACGRADWGGGGVTRGSRCCLAIATHTLLYGILLASAVGQLFHSLIMI